MKKLQLVVIFLIFFISTTPVLAQDILEEGSYKVIVLEKLDLYVDGSITPVIVNITVEMDYLMSAFINLEWLDNDINWDAWGHGNGTDALINGSAPMRDGKVSPNTIKSMKELFATASKINLFTDDKNPVGNHLTVELDYYTYVPSYGIKMKDGHTYGWQINDNIPVFCEDFSVFVIGWKMLELEPDFKRDWLEDMFVFDNPLKFVALIFTIPLLMIFTWEPVGIMIGCGIFIIEAFVILGVWRKLTE